MPKPTTINGDAAVTRSSEIPEASHVEIEQFVKERPRSAYEWIGGVVHYALVIEEEGRAEPA